MCAAAALRLSPNVGRTYYEIAACHEANGNLEASLRNVELAKRWFKSPCWQSIHGLTAAAPRCQSMLWMCRAFGVSSVEYGPDCWCRKLSVQFFYHGHGCFVVHVKGQHAANPTILLVLATAMYQSCRT